MYFFYDTSMFNNFFKIITSGFFNIFIYWILILILYYYSLMKIFTKLERNRWEALIPFYQNYILTNVSGLNWWWLLLTLAYPIANILNLWEISFISKVITFFASWNVFYNIAKKFGYDDRKSILLGIFSPIFVIIKGLNDSNTFNMDTDVYKNGLVDLFYNRYDLDNNKSTNDDDKVDTIEIIEEKEDSTFKENLLNNDEIDNKKGIDIITDNDNKVNEINNIDDLNKDTNTIKIKRKKNIKYCINCGEELSDIMNYCPICGTKKN